MLLRTFSLRQVMHYRPMILISTTGSDRCKPVHTQTIQAIQVCPAHQWPQAA